VRDIQAHNYRPDPYRKMMRENAIKAFKLPSGGLQTRPADWCTLLPGGALESRLNPV